MDNFKEKCFIVANVNTFILIKNMSTGAAQSVLWKSRGFFSINQFQKWNIRWNPPIKPQRADDELIHMYERALCPNLLCVSVVHWQGPLPLRIRLPPYLHPHESLPAEMPRRSQIDVNTHRYFLFIFFLNHLFLCLLMWLYIWMKSSCVCLRLKWKGTWRCLLSKCTRLFVCCHVGIKSGINVVSGIFVHFNLIFLLLLNVLH